MACERITAAGVQISQVTGSRSREANLSTAIQAITALWSWYLCSPWTLEFRVRRRRTSGTWRSGGRFQGDQQ